MPETPNLQHAADYGGGTVIDAGTVDTLRELGGEDDPGLLLELIELFLDDAAERMKTLSAAWDGGDLETVARSAHALKSASANIGALPFSGSCKDVELCAKDGQDEAVGKHVERCCHMFTEVQEALRTMRDEA
jgi:HPt (histidine-containing phosphotransfer) domain-containing protein